MEGLATQDIVDAAGRLDEIKELITRYALGSPDGGNPGRNAWTRAADGAIAWARSYAPPLHWVGVAIVGLTFFVYACLVALTMRLTIKGAVRWPNVPARSVLALWHVCAPSFMVAYARSRPRSRVVIMIAPDPRGDCMALLSKLLGIGVVRGDSGESGWLALAELAREIQRGACALITADGSGPALVAKVGAAALSSATHAPLIAIGADCRPAIVERRKWDKARNPVPFGRVAIALAEPMAIPALEDLKAIESARDSLQRALDEATAAARHDLARR